MKTFAVVVVLALAASLAVARADTPVCYLSTCSGQVCTSELRYCPTDAGAVVDAGPPKPFTFFDGCNTVTCDGRGACTSTLLACHGRTATVTW